MTQQVVLIDTYMWLEPKEGKPGEYNHRRALRDDVIDVSAEELERGQALGALADPDAVEEARQAASDGSVEARQAIAEAAGTAPVLWTDEEIFEANAAELTGYVTQNPNEARRVFELERNREGGPRKTVIRATGGLDPEDVGTDPERPED